MNLIAEWLSRLRNAAREDLRETVVRAVIPGQSPLHLTDTLIKIEPLGPVAPRPGATDPHFASLLRFFDTQPLGLKNLYLASDIGAAISLVSDRKFDVALELPVSVEGSPNQVTFLSLGPTSDFRCRGPFPPDLKERFISFLQRVDSLPTADRDVLGSASRLHYGALVISEADLRSAYLLLVAALEVLSREYGSPPNDWLDWESARNWDQVFESVALNDQQASRLRAELMRDKHLRLKATFRTYVTDTLPKSFWDEPWEDWHQTIHIGPNATRWGNPKKSVKDLQEILPHDRALLHRVLGNTYDLRSGAVHRGVEPEHYDVGIKAAVSISKSDVLPYALLRHIVATLIRYELECRSTEGSKLPDIRFI